MKPSDFYETKIRLSDENGRVDVQKNRFLHEFISDGNIERYSGWGSYSEPDLKGLYDHTVYLYISDSGIMSTGNMDSLGDIKYFESHKYKQIDIARKWCIIDVEKEQLQKHIKQLESELTEAKLKLSGMK